MKLLKSFFSNTDFVLLTPAILVSIFGFITIYPSILDDSTLFIRQGVFVVMGVFLAILISKMDFYFLRNGRIVLFLYFIVCLSLVGLLFFAPEINGAKSWYIFGPIAFQPVDFTKIMIIIFLAKYFSRRHINIGLLRHPISSLVYVAIPVWLVLIQPDFGSAMIIAGIWFGMVLVSGMSKKHFFLFFALGILLLGSGWNFLSTYQQDRIISFVKPFSDIQGTGYNAYQATISVGSGQWFGKGVGQGTQSKLAFLPEYESDFIFAAFSEEWGFVGVVVLFLLFGIIFLRILKYALRGETNFEIFFALGTAIFFAIQLFVHIGVNVGLLPVTGTTMPFMSYGGSHIISEYILLGMIMAMSKYARALHEEGTKKEFYGIGS
ncbi:MAG: FtsW/RodA/SpoVE family cell cycle protein [Candidatus Campbellbacteria bacterium]|nr:FtsW/RodA/SpoVE family cell cycle protein [Candidatus Campbellbacteria bacterium]